MRSLGKDKKPLCEMQGGFFVSEKIKSGTSRKMRRF
jgi:hypothetical protein